MKVWQDRRECISCGACAATAPDIWEMSSEDGKALLIGGKHIKEGEEIVKSEMAVKGPQADEAKRSADVCPVNIIHVE